VTFDHPAISYPKSVKGSWNATPIHVIHLLPSVTQREEVPTPTTGQGGERGFSVRLLGSNYRFYLEILSTTKNHSLGM
jgi:hypothetical protein